MNEQELFSKNIEELVQFAKVNDNKINITDVDIMFKEMELTKEQLELIYSYLKLNKITVIKDGKEYEKSEEWYAKKSDTVDKEDEEDEDASDAPEDEERGIGSYTLESGENTGTEELKLSEEEAIFLDMYMEDMAQLKQLSEEEIVSYVSNYNEVAKNAIIENYLKDVIKWIKPYINKGLLYGDLIQEANIGLMQAVDTLDKSITDIDVIEEYIKKHTIKYVKDAIDESEASQLIGDKVTNRINAVNDCAIMLSEDLGRKPTKEEVIKMMNIDMDELEDIIKLAGDKIETISKN